MKLVKPSFLEKKEEGREYFLSLILRNEKVIAVVFEKVGSQIKYLNKGEKTFKTTIENADTEEFLDVLDKAIGEAESVLPPNIESHKTLFALKGSWVEDNKIRKEYLELLKKADNELSLNPIGFLVFAESIINLVQKEEGAPVSTILAEIGEKFVTAYLVKAGKIIEAKTSEIHDSPAQTLDLILKHLEGAEVLPARIIVAGDLEEDLSQEFIGFTWSKTLPFLHLPQVTTLPEDSSVKAVLLGAATQMNVDLVYNPDEQVGSEIPPVKENTTSIESDNLEGGDDSKELFGFVEGADVIKNAPKKLVGHSETESEVLHEEISEIPEEIKIKEEEKENIGAIGVSMTDKVKETFAAVIASLGKINFKNLPAGGAIAQRKILLIPVILGLLVIIFLFVLAMNAKAKVEIFVTPKTEQKTTDVTFSPTSDTNIDNKVLKIDLVSVDEDGQTTITTTGKKDVGDKAKGTVTLFNNDTDPVSLNSGTTITASSGQKFTLDSNVKVASASGDIFSGTKPGTTDAKITASDIGQEYNLPSGTKFTVGSSTTVAAKNDNAFSGGTKKSERVVSKDDIAKAEAQLPKDLSDKARSDLSSKVEEGHTLLPDFVSTDLLSEDFSNKVNDSADNLTLKAKVSFNFVSYKNSDMQALVEKNFTNNSSLGNGLEVNAKDISVLKNKNISATLNINAKLLPKIQNEQLAQQIAGESILKARNEIVGLNQVADVTITISPHIPFLSNNLPKNYKKIEIVVTAR